MLMPQAAGALPVPGAGAVELGFSRVSCPASTAFPQGPGVFQYHCDKSCKLASAYIAVAFPMCLSGNRQQPRKRDGSYTSITQGKRWASSISFTYGRAR